MALEFNITKYGICDLQIVILYKLKYFFLLKRYSLLLLSLSITDILKRHPYELCLFLFFVLFYLNGSGPLNDISSYNMDSRTYSA